jgi:hypothetical protein
MKTDFEAQVDSLVLAYTRKRGSLPPGFDFMEVNNPSPRNPDNEVRKQLEQLHRSHSETLLAKTYLGPAGLKLLADPGLQYWTRKAWSVRVNASDQATAKRMGQVILKSLRPKSHLTAADPYLYGLPLFVRFTEGWVEVEGLAPKEKVRTTPTVSDQKAKIQRLGEEFFGAGSIRLLGKDGAYTMHITPKLREHKGLFKDLSARGQTLDELSLKLSRAIDRAKQFLANR